MGSLSNLYISSSFQSLLHFGSDNTASINLTQIQDGFGNGLGFYLNSIGSASLDGDLTVGGDFIVSGAFDIEGKVTINDNVRVNGNLEVSGSTKLTGSLEVSTAITASNAFITNDLNVGGTLFANKVVTLIESSSIIFSSGSNILGDSILDTQTLNGTIIMSGSSSLTGSMGITGDISSSTISGIGNVTLYSQSVDARLDIVEATASLYVPFSQSIDSRLDYLEGPFSSSVNQQLVTLQLFTASVGLVTTASFQSFTASTNADLVSIHQTTASLNTFTASQETKNITLANYTASNDTKWSTLSSYTSSLNTRLTYTPTTGSNVYVGNQIFSGSVRGQVFPLTITTLTASMDCSLGNFFTLQLISGTVNLTPTNIQPGETITLKLTQAATPGTLTTNSLIKFPFAQSYNATQISGAVDIITFISFDTSSLNAAATLRLT